MIRHFQVIFLSCVFLSAGLVMWVLSRDFPVSWRLDMLLPLNRVAGREAPQLPTIPGHWDYFSSPSCLVDPNDQDNNIHLRGFLHNLKTFIPFPHGFDPNYTSPCWHTSIGDIKREGSETKDQIREIKAATLMSSLLQPGPKSLICIPQVYFIGYPKSGTTQLFKMVTKHPGIKGGYCKEPHWWTRTKHPLQYPGSVVDILNYLQYFKSVSRQYIEQKNPNSLLIEASQSTAWDTTELKNFCFLPQLFANMRPGAKFIVLMREPVDRLFSDFKYFYKRAWEKSRFKRMPEAVTANLTKIFHEKVKKQIYKMEECLKVDSLDVCVHRDLEKRTETENCTVEPCFDKYIEDHVVKTMDFTIKHIPRSFIRLGVSLYHVHIRRWLREIPREQFLFLRMDELANSPFQLLREVWYFLGVQEQSEEELKSILYSHTRSNSVGSSIDMEKETKEILMRFFQPHKVALADLLKDDRFKW